MPVVQVTIWVCGCCGATSTVTQETTPYADPHGEPA